MNNHSNNSKQLLSDGGLATLAKLAVLLVGTAFLVSISACSRVYIGTDAGTVASSLVIETFQNSSRADWNTDDEGRALSQSRVIHFTGMCARGTYKVQVTDKTTTKVLGTADCNKQSTFDWTTLVDRDGEFDLHFAPMNLQLQAFGVEAREVINVVSTAPSSPIILTNSGAGFISPNQHVILRGTVTDDVTDVKSPPNGTLQFDKTNHTFEYEFDMVERETRYLKFISVNTVGLESDPTEITVSYRPAYTLGLVGFTSVRNRNGISVSEAGNYKMTNVSSNPFIQTFPSVSQGGTVQLATGLSAIASRRK